MSPLNDTRHAPDPDGAGKAACPAELVYALAETVQLPSVNCCSSKSNLPSMGLGPPAFNSVALIPLVVWAADIIVGLTCTENSETRSGDEGVDSSTLRTSRE